MTRDVTPQSEGHRLLLELGETQTQIARVCDVRPSAVNNWFAGLRAPTEDSQKRLEVEYGIPVASWSERVEVEDDDEDDEPTGGGEPETIAEVDKLIREIRKARSKVPSKDLVPLFNAEGRMLSIRAKIEERAKLFEDKAIRMAPFWKRLRTTLVNVLKKHPQVRDELEAALEEIGANE